jgi:hypothetical protein
MSSSECNQLNVEASSVTEENTNSIGMNSSNGCVSNGCSCQCICHNSACKEKEAPPKNLNQCGQCKCYCVCEKGKASKKCPKCQCDCETCTPDKCCCDIAKAQIKKTVKDDPNNQKPNFFSGLLRPEQQLPTAANYLGLIIYNARDNAAGKFRNTIMLNSNIIKAYGRGEIFAHCIDSTIVVKRGLWDSAGFGFVTFNNESEAHAFFSTTTEFSDWYWMNQSDIHVMPMADKLLSINEMPIVCLDLVEYKRESNECGMSVADIARLQTIVKSCNGHLVVATDTVRRERGSKYIAFVAVTQWRDIASFELFHNTTSKNQGDGTCCLRLSSQMESFVK